MGKPRTSGDATTSSSVPKATRITKIVVNLGRQKLFAYAGANLVYEFHAVTGRKGKSTDLGVHRIFRKHEQYTSRTYGVPMNYAMFFTMDGKAIHHSNAGWVWPRSFGKALGAEELGITLGSHGCVGLDEDDAKVLFEKTPLRTVVEVVSGE